MSIPALAIAGAELAIGVASGVATAAASVSSYKQGIKRYEDNVQASRDAFVLETHLINKRLSEEKKATSQKKSDNTIKRMQAGASGLAMAAAGGVQGASVEQILDDFRRSEGVVGDRLDQSMAARSEQAHYDMMGSAAKAQRRINSVPIPSQAEAYAGVARGVSTAVSSYSDFNDLYAGEEDE